MFRPLSMPRGLLACAAYLAVLLPVLAPALLPAGALAGGDWTDLLYPFREFTASTFREAGRLPMWNPLIFSGVPHLASLNALALYPTEIATLILPLAPSTFYAADLILHLLIAAAGMRWWLLRTGAGEGGAFTGGLFYALGGHCFTLAAAGHPHWVRCLAWCPFLFAALEGWPRRGAAAGAAGGAVLSLAVLGASMHFVLLAVPVSAAWILLVGDAPVRSRLAALAAFLVVPGILGAVVWMPGFEYYLESVRRSPVGGGAEWSLSPWELPALLVPGLWGHPDAYWGPHPFRASGDYPGLLCIALAGAGVVAGGRSTVRWAVLVAAGVLLSFGSATPAGSFLGSLPVFSGLRVPLRWLSFAHFGVCVLAARGWDAAASRRGGRIAAAGLALLAVACAAGAALAPAAGVHAARLGFVGEHVAGGQVRAEDLGTGFGNAARDGFVRSAASAVSLGCLAAAPGPLAWRAGLAWLASCADLLTASSPYFQYADSREARQPDPVAEVLLRRVPPGTGRIATDEYFGLPNRRMPLGLEFTWGYHGLPLARYARLHDAVVETGSVGMLGVLSVKCVVSGVRPPPGWPSVEAVEDLPGHRVWVMANPAILPRAWLAPATVPVGSTDEAVALMRRPGWTPALIPVEGAVPGGGSGVRGRNEAVIGSGTDELDAALDLSSGGLIVFSEVWYPAWKAYLDGERVAILRACGALRAVIVPRGRHRVRMTYDSWPSKIGLWLSIVGWTVVALLGRRLFRA